jgi:metal-responsive CopG/Arc/MetJ family transcriptional regulator
MTVQIALRISEDLAASVDRLCSADGGTKSRSEFLRVAIEKHVAEQNKAIVDAQIVAGYLAKPADQTVDQPVDEWGDLATQHDWLNAENAKTLDSQDGGW